MIVAQIVPVAHIRIDACGFGRRQALEAAVAFQDPVRLKDRETIERKTLHTFFYIKN